MDRGELLRVLKAFEDEGLEYILIGATALALHGIVRATEDVDFFIRATSDNVERLKRALRTVYAEGASMRSTPRTCSGNTRRSGTTPRREISTSTF